MSDCGKVRYRDRIAALMALMSTKRKQATGRAKDEMRAYRCPLCMGWHLTSQQKRQTRKEKP